MKIRIFAAALAVGFFTLPPGARAQEHGAAPAEKHDAAAPDAATHEPAAHDAGGHEAAAHGAAAETHGDAHGGHQRSPWELRFSLETPLYTHISTDEFSGSTNFTKSFELGLSVMLSYIVVPHKLTLDLEVTESELFGSELEEGTPKRAGTTLRLGGSYRPLSDSPIYLAALTTYHLEPHPFVFGLRLGAGLSFPIADGLQFFGELDLDLPLASSSGGPSAFQQQTVVLATGILWHLP